MHDFDLFDDGCSIGRDEQSTQVIDQEFITTCIVVQRGTNQRTTIVAQRTIWTKTRPHETRQLRNGQDVAQDGILEPLEVLKGPTSSIGQCAQRSVSRVPPCTLP